MLEFRNENSKIGITWTQIWFCLHCEDNCAFYLLSYYQFVCWKLCSLRLPKLIIKKRIFLRQIVHDFFLRPRTAKEWVFDIDLYTKKWGRNYRIILRYLILVGLYRHLPWLVLRLRSANSWMCVREQIPTNRTAGIFSMLIGWYMCLFCMHTVNVYML